MLHFERYRTLLLVMGCCFASGFASADWHAGFGLQRHDIKFGEHSSTTSAGTIELSNIASQGVGPTASISFPFEQNNNVTPQATFDLDYLATLGIKLQSVPSQRGASAFVTLGVARSSLSAAAPGQQITSNHTGPFINVGLALEVGQNVSISADMGYHAVDESIDIPSLRIGLVRLF